jgi:hypothetical protein
MSWQGTEEGGADMMHFSCDLCGKQMASGARARFIVKMEVFAANDPAELTDEDLDADHLDEISQVLSDDETAADEELAPAYKKLRYDLCPACHKKFLGDPLGRETANKFDFSEN